MSSLAQKTDEFLSRQAGVADQRSQETSSQLSMSRNGEPPAGRPDENHVAARRSIESESHQCDRHQELVS